MVPHLLLLHIFTFHYVYIYILPRKSVERSCDIYIPLCLYLYYFYPAALIILFLFTFHYVYIYILLRHTFATSFVHLHSTMFIFISWQGLLLQLLLLYLHSTMFIFISFCIPFDLINCIIYIPLCLYLYPFCCVFGCYGKNLHSTMFIFIYF